MRFQLVFHPFPELSCPKPHCKQCVFLLCAPGSRHPSRPPLGSGPGSGGSGSRLRSFFADGFYLPAPGAPGAPGTLHSHTASSRTPGGHSSGASTKGSSREGPAKERTGRSGEPPPLFGKKDPRAREEAAGLRGVVDLTQEARAEGRQDRGPPRLLERLSPFLAEPGPLRAPGSTTAESKGKNPPPPLPLSLCNGTGTGDVGLPALVAEGARGTKDIARQDESSRLRRAEALLPGPCPCPSPLPPPPPPPSKGPPAPPAASGAFAAPQPAPTGVYTIFPAAAAREPGREHRVVAPTFVPSVEAFDERPGPIQIASQARDSRAREREVGRPGVLQGPPGSPRPPPDRPESLREKSSVIRSLKRPPPAEAPPARAARASPDPRAYLPAKELLKPEAEPRPCERALRGPAATAASQQAAKLFGLEPGRPPPPAGPEHKWKPFELGNFATTQMAVLAAQHHHASRAEEEAAAAASKKAYLDPGGALPRAATCARPGADIHAAAHGPGEASAMQSLIKYSGSFAREAVTVRPGGCGKKSPFGGLGTMKPEPAPTATPRAQTRLPHPGGPAASSGRQLKRDPERPESAKAFGREGSGAQGEAEVRHPPVGIAVAVARQKDSGGNGRLAPGLAEQERSLSLSNVKGESWVPPPPPAPLIPLHLPTSALLSPCPPPPSTPFSRNRPGSFCPLSPLWAMTAT